MTIAVRCSRVSCTLELTEPGGLAFSPPLTGEHHDAWDVKKFHLCASCWDDFVEWMLDETT